MTEKKKESKKTEKEEKVAEILKGVPEDVETPEAKEPSEDEMVTIPLKEYADQLEELDSLRAKVDDFSDGWQRERADFSNYRKRLERDQESNRTSFRIDILRKYLDVHDDLERAVKNMPDDVAASPWVSGLELIFQKLARLLENEGIEEIEAKGKAFNPDLHEAISSEESPDFESEEIIEVVQKGYKLGERVIRSARVIIAK
jgi:molecular chaperone GrpE